MCESEIHARDFGFMQDSIPVSTSTVHKTLGRHTLAGRLAYNLYHGRELDRYVPSVSVSIGPSVNPQTEALRRIQERAWEVRKRNKIQVPGPGRRKRDEEEELEKRLNGAHKKTEEVIRKQMGIEFPKNKPLRTITVQSREDKIALTQMAMEYRGKVPSELINQNGKKDTRQKSKIEQNSMQAVFDVRFKEIFDEIKEREDFLKAMEMLGHGKEHEKDIMSEIADRLREMEEIDQKLQQLATIPSPIVHTHKQTAKSIIKSLR